MKSKALNPGTVVKGNKHSYTIESLLHADGQGYTYKTVMPVTVNGNTVMRPTVLREHFMPRCCDRSKDDGATVEVPEDIAPTVKSCLDSFIFSSLEREKVSHESPWIINVLETFEANNTYYYAVEYLDGETLGEYVERMGGKLTFEQTRQVISPIFDAVRTMHRLRALHTNLHPGHVKFTGRGDKRIPKLFSLYCSLHFSDNGIQRWTLPLMNCEKGYAPPEQYLEIEHFAPQVDIYALASIMTYCLSGKELPDSRQLTEEIVRATLPEGLPDQVVLALLNALDPDMSKRTATITKFREELGSFLSQNTPEQSSDSDNDDSDEARPGLLVRLRKLFSRK